MTRSRSNAMRFGESLSSAKTLSVADDMTPAPKYASHLRNGSSRIRRYTSSQAVGLDVIVFVQVGLATQSADSAQAFGKLIRGMEEVQEAFSLTGEADYLVKMAVPDLKTPSRILNDVFLPHRSVAHVRSSVVLDRIKETTRLPLRHLSEAKVARPARRRRRH